MDFSLSFAVYKYLNIKVSYSNCDTKVPFNCGCRFQRKSKKKVDKLALYTLKVLICQGFHSGLIHLLPIAL